MKKYLAELIGTMVLVIIGCGSAIFAGGAVGTLGIAFAFGLAVVAMAYTIGGISGCHINPAITLGALLTGRISGKDAGMYMLFQTLGAILGSAILYGIAISSSNYECGMAVATGANMPTAGILQAFIVEVVFTCIFVLVVLGSTSKQHGTPKAGLAIGLALVMIHIVCIPLTGTSVNPARSIGPAIFAGAEALKYLWIFILAPFVGAILSAVLWKAIAGTKE